MENDRPVLSEQQVFAAVDALSECGFRHWRGDVTPEQAVNAVWTAILSFEKNAPLKISQVSARHR